MYFYFKRSHYYTSRTQEKSSSSRKPIHYIRVGAAPLPSKGVGPSALRLYSHNKKTLDGMGERREASNGAGRAEAWRGGGEGGRDPRARGERREIEEEEEGREGGWGGQRERGGGRGRKR